MSKVTELMEQFYEQVAIIDADRETIETKKASSKRIRKATLEIAKIGKELRKATVEAEK